jgi:hypothetical protein
MVQKAIGLAVVAGCLLSFVRGQNVPIDGILAVVDEQVITLTDFKIARSFGLYHSVRSDDASAVSSLLILESLIDQKLVVLMINPSTRVHSNELEQGYQDLISRFGSESLQQKMAELDLDRGGLFQYLEEAIVYRRILAQRFQQSVGVNLRQIENYYENTYVPEMRAKGMEPSPMLDILKQLESAVIAESTRSLILEWVGNLRDEADILILADQYPQFFNK